MDNLKILRNNLTVQYVRNGRIYGSEDQMVFKSADGGRSWKKVCALQSGKRGLHRLKDVFLRNSFVNYIRQNIGIQNVVVLKSGTLIIQYDRIYRHDGTGRCASPVFDMKHVSAPLKNGIGYDEEKDILYFGEYICSRPNAIRIFRGTNDGRDWECCYQFPMNRIRHVHGIIPDPYRRCIWICTGDDPEESGLFYTEDGFNTVHLFGGGDYSWRMVSMTPAEDALIWGSDAGQDAPAETVNYIYRWDFTANARERLMRIDKPAYYAMRLKSGLMAIGTTYEPLIKFKTAPTADIWTSEDGKHWQMILSLEYQVRRRGYGTKYATIQFPSGNSADSLLFTPLNVKDYDFKAVRYRF